MMTLFKFKMEVTLTSSMCCSTQLLIKLNKKNQYEFIGTQRQPVSPVVIDWRMENHSFISLDIYLWADTVLGELA